MKLRHAAVPLVALVSIPLLLHCVVWAETMPTSDLALWLDASDRDSVRNAGNLPAADGEGVETWLDKIGTSEDASPNAAAPSYDVGGSPFGKPVIDFNYASAVANRQDLVSGSVTARTVVLAHRWETASPGNGSYFFDFRPGITNSYVWYTGPGANWTYYVNDSTTAGSAVGEIWNDQWQVTTFVGSGTGSNPMHIFSRYMNQEYGLGQVGEILVYDSVLTEAARLQAAGYLYEKWLVPEPSSFLLATLGLIGLGCVGQFRRKRKV